LRRSWPLDNQQSLDPRQAWRWLGAAWIHQRGLEASVNLLVLLVLIGDSAAQLGDVVLRYSLTALATLIPAVILSARWRLQRQWSGSAGSISALIALAAGLSLLHGRALSFDTPLFSVPAWVLLLVVGALQLHWQLPSTEGERNGTPLQRLLGSQWAWGVLLGLSWALVTWGQELVKASGTHH
jgi:membrane associated rhomboid family serine protease